MDKYIRETIPLLETAKVISKIHKGFSHDEKYAIDDQYLLRIFPIDDLNKRREEFETINDLAKYSVFVPRGLDFGRLKNKDKAYMVISYIPGIDGEVALKNLTKEEQYEAGYIGGKELNKLHQLPAPSGYPSWYSIKKRKSNHYLNGLKSINRLDPKIKDMLESYILHHENLMIDRPNQFQHDDFHPTNIIIHNKTFAGIIDFQRMDWGDPIHDLHKLGFFSKRISIDFTKGVIDGYHENQPLTESFWRLYTLYSAMHIVSALVWGLKISEEQYELLLDYSHEVIEDHNHFQSIVPKWYQD